MLAVSQDGLVCAIKVQELSVRITKTAECKTFLIRSSVLVFISNNFQTAQQPIQLTRNGELQKVSGTCHGMSHLESWDCLLRSLGYDDIQTFLLSNNVLWAKTAFRSRIAS